MAGFSLLALLDDITTILDDVALMTKVAAKKTAGVLGDDLALNAQQVSGVAADRELPVVWAVARGSLVNKLILIPAALIISALAPALIRPLLMVGGAYLCFEGAEKLFHKFFQARGKNPEPEKESPSEPAAGPDREKLKIKGAIRTDFVLSAEIIVIALGTVPEDASLALRAGVLSLIGLLMTAGVYGLVAGIVKLDDLGFWLLRKKEASGLRRKLGSMLLTAAPRLMRVLAVVGTAAMFLVGGGILSHGLPFYQGLSELWAAWPGVWLWPHLFSLLAGLLAGAVLLAVITLGGRLLKKRG